jgi:hypothetical protein
LKYKIFFCCSRQDRDIIRMEDKKEKEPQVFLGYLGNSESIQNELDSFDAFSNKFGGFPVHWSNADL